jgi:hypothetical protein
MSTWQPPWSAQGQFAVTLLPPTRASNSVTARRPPGPGSTPALRAGSRGPLHPATCPPIWAGSAGASPTRPCQARRRRRQRALMSAQRWLDSAGVGAAADYAAAPEARALRATPSPPSPTTAPSTTRAEDPAGGNRPDVTTASPTGGVGRGRERVCPTWVGEQSKHGCAETQWQTPRRRRRTDGARIRRHPNLRRGRLHHPALPVQPRPALRDPPRVGPAGGDSAAATLPLSCRDRWSAQLGHLARIRQQGHGRG